jgi:hypothetical protein
VKKFVDDAIRMKLEGRTPALKSPVEKKPACYVLPTKGEGPKPWELPPFWERKGTVEPVEANPDPAKVDEDDEDDEDPPRTPKDDSGGNVAAAIGEPYQPISEMKLIGA